MAAAAITALSNPKSNTPSPSLATGKTFPTPNFRRRSLLQLASSRANDGGVIPAQSDDRVYQQDGVVCLEREDEATEAVVGVFGSEAPGRLSFEGAAGFSSAASGVGGPPGSGDGLSQEEEMGRFCRHQAAYYIDHDYWHLHLPQTQMLHSLLASLSPYNRVSREPTLATYLSHKSNRILATRDNEPMGLGVKQLERAFTKVILLFLQLACPIPLTSHHPWLINSFCQSSSLFP